MFFFSNQEQHEVIIAFLDHFPKEGSSKMPSTPNLINATTHLTTSTSTSAITEEEASDSRNNNGQIIIENGCSKDEYELAGRAHMWINFSVFFLLPVLVSLENQLQVNVGKILFHFFNSKNSYLLDFVVIFSITVKVNYMAEQGPLA